jgi:lysophospholipase L1-like esterase
MNTTIKTAIITFVAGILFVASLPLGASIVSAEGSPDVSNSAAESLPEATKRIWAGLWAGANLNVDDRQPDPRDTRKTGATGTYTNGNGSSSSPNGTARQPAPRPAGYRYVALGDSIAAGAGLPLPANASANDRTCKRSPEAYPAIVAQTRSLPVIHVACSGAKATNLLLWQGIRDQPNPSRQISYIFAGGTPELVTITAGANDMYWSEFMLKCYRQGPSCGPETLSRRGASGTDYDTRTTDYLLGLLRGKWELFFTELEVRSGGRPPTVVVTGYYDPFSPQCLSLAPDRVTQAELDWASGRIDALNRTLETAVSGRPYVRFAPVDFTGHDVCSGDSWLQGIDTRNGNAPIHPTAEGQRAIADAVLRTL